MTAPRVRRIELRVARISPKTRWVFVSIERDDGAIGIGEASLNGKEAALGEAANAFALRLFAARLERPQDFAAAIAPADLVQAAIVSALDQALWDAHARAQGIRLIDALGGARREAIRLYANINRRTEPRTPTGFAQSAAIALAAGYTALKLAPFDAVDPAICAAGRGVSAMQAGLACVAAVRAVAGPACLIMIDCHWRFDEATARELIAAAAEHGVGWFECPLPETAANIPALVRLRGQANRMGMRQAGLEHGIGWQAFRPYCEAGAYDVVMPDVKYMGGLTAMLHCAEECARLGIESSPHNPTGPISHAASLAVAAAQTTFDMLEIQFDETPLFDSLVTGLPARAGGQSPLSDGAGLGVDLDPAQLDAHADVPVRVWESP